MSTTAVRSPAEFEDQLQQYLYDRSEESRAVRVGEKEVSEQAAIVARYSDLFSRDQLRALRDGEELPLRSALARLAILPDYKDRDDLGTLHQEKSAEFNEERLELLRAYEELEADLSEEPDPISRTEEEKQISLRELESVLAAASDEVEAAFLAMRERWFERLLGTDREEQPASAHMAYIRRLSPLDSTYTKERATEVCLATLSALGFDMASDRNIRLDLDDRPQKSPRACVIASDPPRVVH